MQQLKIALVGYGRMGKEVERTALSRGHEIVCRIDNELDWQTENEIFKCADIAVDFSVPSAVLDNMERCFRMHKPVVVGTTAWQKSLPQIRKQVELEGQSLFYASNFSIGVHLLYNLARSLSRKMNDLPQYNGSIREIHHIHKLDKPSGTAVNMADIVTGEMLRYSSWKLVEDLTGGGKGTDPDTLPVYSIREGEVVGEHELCFDSVQDSLRIIHTAKSRAGLALGAVCAAEWLMGKTGCFTMEDMLGF